MKDTFSLLFVTLRDALHLVAFQGTFQSTLNLQRSALVSVVRLQLEETENDVLSSEW